MNLSIILLVFSVIFIVELPDKSMLATVTLSTRFRKLYVWLGAAVAFLIHVILAVTLGNILTFLPKQVVELVVAILFIIGAYIVLTDKSHDEAKISSFALKGTKFSPHSFLKAFTTSFIIVFLGEWGDISQIVTANYTAKFHDGLSVGVGAVLGLWAVSAFGIIAGTKVLKRVPAQTVHRLMGSLLLIFALFSLIAAFD